MAGNEKVVFRVRLREAMDLRKLSAADLARKANVPKGAISYYLAGKSEPKVDRVHALSVALDVAEAWLLGYDVPRERTDSQKKNDQLAELVVRLRREPELFDAVLCLTELSAEQFAAAWAVISALHK